MRLEDLHHVVGETEFVVVGSQSILGSYPDAPEALLRSQEADIYPLRAPETARAPSGWEARLVVVEVPPRPASRVRAVALCLEPHDLVLSKLAANRERDWDFAKEALVLAS